MNFKKLTAGAAVMTILVPASVVSVFATTGTVLSNKDLETMTVTVVAVEYNDEVKTIDDLSITLTWEELEEYLTKGKERASTYTVYDYKYVTYGSIPPKTLYITVEKNGKTYAENITRSKYVYDSANDKYTGYYGGKIKKV